MKRHELPPLLKAQFDENIREQLMKVQEPTKDLACILNFRISRYPADPAASFRSGKQVAVPKCVVRDGMNTLISTGLQAYRTIPSV